jgi:MoaA/NifB/PqqE/SkfB family radical SAM enzyme
LNTALRKQANLHLNYLEKRAGRRKLISRPWKFFIEVSQSCNLKCIMCLHRKRRLAGIMSDTLFHSLKDELTLAAVVHEHGYGEPFLDRGFISKLEFLKTTAGAYVDVFTNAVLLTPALSAQLTALGLNQVTISVDGATKETFESIRAGADFECVIEHIKALDAAKKHAGSVLPYIRINWVGMARNIEELPRFIETAADIGAGEVVLGDLFEPDAHLAGECLYYHPEITNRAVAAARKIADQKRINFIAPTVFRRPETAPVDSGSSPPAAGTPSASTSPSPAAIPPDSAPAPNAPIAPPAPPVSDFRAYPCREPWQTAYITWDGKVKPCCAMDIPFGDLAEAPLREIWNNDRFALLRKTVNSTPAFPACRSCLLRRRVRLSATQGVSLFFRSLQNDGVFRTVGKTVKYLREYR